MSGYIRWLGEPDSAEAHEVGEIGAWMGRLHQEQFPVPPGFSILTRAYDLFRRQSGVADEARDWLRSAGLAAARPGGRVEELLAKLRQAPVPQAVAAEIRDAAGRLAAEANTGGVLLAVSVSLTARPDAKPFLPLRKSLYLPLRAASEAALLGCVRDCWAFAWSPPVLETCLFLGLDPLDLRVAALVQALAQSATAGRLVTLNPAAPGRHEMVLSACWGLGEVVRPGEGESDEFVLRRESVELLDQKMGNKERALVPGTNGSQALVETTIPEDKAEMPCLAWEQIREIADTGREVERLLGCPLEMAWTLGKGGLTILAAVPLAPVALIGSASGPVEHGAAGEPGTFPGGPGDSGGGQGSAASPQAGAEREPGTGGREAGDRRREEPAFRESGPGFPAPAETATIREEAGQSGRGVGGPGQEREAARGPGREGDSPSGPGRVARLEREGVEEGEVTVGGDAVHFVAGPTTSRPAMTRGWKMDRYPDWRLNAGGRLRAGGLARLFELGKRLRGQGGPVREGDEFHHDHDQGHYWNESYYFNFSDTGQQIGGFSRIGMVPNQDLAVGILYLFLPAGGILVLNQSEPCRASRDDLSVGLLRYERVRPLREWRIRFQGSMLYLPDPQVMLRFADPLPDGAPGQEWEYRDVSLDLTYKGWSDCHDFKDADPRFIAERLVNAGSRLTDLMAVTKVAAEHYEQVGEWSGEIVVGRERLRIQGSGHRDHSWGERDWKAPERWTWLTAQFGREFGFNLSRVVIKSLDIYNGYVSRSGRNIPLRRAWLETEFEQDGLTQKRVRVRLEDTSGWEAQVEGSPRLVVPLTLRDGVHRTRVNEALTEYSWQGRRGLGISEYLHQLGV